MGGTTVRLELTTRDQPPITRGSVDFNPSRLVDAPNDSPLPYSEVMGAIGRVIPVTFDWLRPALPPEMWRVTRVDVACDFFDVQTPSFYIEGLRGGSPPYRPAVHLHGGRRGSTLYVKTKTSGQVRLYDRHAASDGRIPSGTLRFEVEARVGEAGPNDTEKSRTWATSHRSGFTDCSRTDGSGRGSGPGLAGSGSRDFTSALGPCVYHPRGTMRPVVAHQCVGANHDSIKRRPPIPDRRGDAEMHRRGLLSDRGGLKLGGSG